MEVRPPAWLTLRPARPCHLLLSRSPSATAASRGGTAAQCAFPSVGVLPTLTTLAHQRNTLTPPRRGPAGPHGAAEWRSHFSRAALLASTDPVPAASISTRRASLCLVPPAAGAAGSLFCAAVAGHDGQRRCAFSHSVPITGHCGERRGALLSQAAAAGQGGAAPRLSPVARRRRLAQRLGAFSHSAPLPLSRIA